MTPADLAESMVPVACDLACRVRDGDRDGIDCLTASLSKHETRALLVVLAAMVPVEERSAADLLAWVGGGPVTVLPQLRAGGEPKPDGYTAQELRDAAAEAARLKRAGRPVPGDLAPRVSAYKYWRKQCQGARKASGPEDAATREGQANAA